MPVIELGCAFGAGHIARELRASREQHKLVLPEICPLSNSWKNHWMKSNPILEEVWWIKDQLAAEAGYDADRFFDNLQQWMAENPPSGPVARNAEELRQFIADKARQQANEAALREEPPRPSDKP